MKAASIPGPSGLEDGLGENPNDFIRDSSISQSELHPTSIINGNSEIKNSVPDHPCREIQDMTNRIHVPEVDDFDDTPPSNKAVTNCEQVGFSQVPMFTTASNKAINVSEEALRRARSMFQFVEDEAENESSTRSDICRSRRQSDNFEGRSDEVGEVALKHNHVKSSTTPLRLSNTDSTITPPGSLRSQLLSRRGLSSRTRKNSAFVSPLVGNRVKAEEKVADRVESERSPFFPSSSLPSTSAEATTPLSCKSVPEASRCEISKSADIVNNRTAAGNLERPRLARSLNFVENEPECRRFDSSRIGFHMIGRLPCPAKPHSKFFVKGYLFQIKDNMVYLGCSLCRKKMVSFSTGDAVCEKCKISDRSYYFSVQAQICDFSGTVDVVIFEAFKHLSVMSAEEWYKLDKYSPDKALQRRKSIEFRPKIFHLSFQRNQWTVDSVEDVDFECVNSYICDIIKTKKLEHLLANMPQSL